MEVALVLLCLVTTLAHCSEVDVDDVVARATAAVDGGSGGKRIRVGGERAEVDDEVKPRPGDVFGQGDVE